MTTIFQLALDGREVPHEDVLRGPSRRTPLTEAQKDILRRAVLNRRGWIRAAEAGRIVHAHRVSLRCGGRARVGALSCCRYAASDGTDACKRLVARGLLVRIERGVYVLTEEA